ncbi:tetratricopeptide repeat protein [Catenuloplanes japonicus]|uniref:tetratricopeptide repeat protein n=1 Tax=Catenuloplanes japonicus TaxID=33876 RepID=UPI00068E67EC|nr:tetratricopeptide repeat protein [Catenuloplanes japonicus]
MTFDPNDPRVLRGGLLTQRAQVHAAEGRADLALEAHEESAVLVRALIAEDPGEPRFRQQLAATLYGLASSYSAVGRPGDAVTALNECEEAYRGLSGSLDVAPLLADVQARRGLAQMQRGFVASAVLELDEAVSAYVILTERDDTHKADLARVLSLNAQVLSGGGGDPDLAVRSADMAVRHFLQLADRINARPDAPVYARYLRGAARLAAEIHGGQGDLEMATQAADIAVTVARSLAPAGLHEIRELIDALARSAAHLRAAGRIGEADAALAEARLTDPDADEAYDADWTRLTLAAALEAAGNALGRERVESLSVLVTPPEGTALVIPTGRCPMQLAPAYAEQLAALAVALLDADPETGIRLAMEAHYLFAGASSAQTVQMRYQFAHPGTQWARLLLTFSRWLEAAGASPLALDLAGWLSGVAQRLMPFALLDADLRALVADSFEHHGNLLMASGDAEAGLAAINAAVRLR